jgi:hypothetical protein
MTNEERGDFNGVPKLDGVYPNKVQLQDCGSACRKLEKPLP